PPTRKKLRRERPVQSVVRPVGRSSMGLVPFKQGGRQRGGGEGAGSLLMCPGGRELFRMSTEKTGGPPGSGAGSSAGPFGGSAAGRAGGGVGGREKRKEPPQGPAGEGAPRLSRWWAGRDPSQGGSSHERRHRVSARDRCGPEGRRRPVGLRRLAGGARRPAGGVSARRLCPRGDEAERPAV